MFELDKYDEKTREAPPVVPAGPLLPPLPVDKLSLLAWGEHCIECAVPNCYSTCDLYDPRYDLRCRRFEYGIFRNDRFESARGFGAEVSFRKWAKLETRGNARLVPAWQLRLLERGIHHLSRLGNLLGRIVGTPLGDIRFNYVSYALIEKLIRWQRQRGLGSEIPSGFLIEIYNPLAEPVDFKLSMQIERKFVPANVPVDQLPPPFFERISVPPGHFRHFIRWAEFARITESGLAFDVSFVPEKTEGIQVVFLMLDFVKLSEDSTAQLAEARQPVIERPDAKCVIFDLDNTLWDGVLLEKENVELRPGVRAIIEEVDKRGILLSVASKNAHDHAWGKLDEFGLDEYFLYPKINWMPKSKNIRQIAEDLNIGLDTFVFVDDNPAELKEVGSALPAVECVIVDELDRLLDRPRLQGSPSDEAGQRRQFYRDAIAREETQTGFGDDYIGFLRSCGIQLDLWSFREENFERTAELVQRTNQLNFSGRHYDRAEIREVIDRPDLEKWVLSCRDDFGSYGIVGFCISRREGSVVHVEDFMLSCRVQGKFIEQALFAFLTAGDGDVRCSQIIVHFRQTDRNTPARQVLDALGFEELAEDRLGLDLSARDLTCDFIEVSVG